MCARCTRTCSLETHASCAIAHALAENARALSLSLPPLFTRTRCPHKIQMSPQSILCETLLSWLLPRLLLQRIGMLIKACSLKLIRRRPGSFIKIDILAAAPSDEPIQDTGRSGRMDPEKDREGERGCRSTSQVAQLSSIEPLELRRGDQGCIPLL